MQKTLILGVYAVAFLSANAPLWAADNAPASDKSNQEVLDAWQQQSGQTASTTQGKNGTEIQWHGQVSNDLYNVDTSQPAGTLTGRKDGLYTYTTVQGDLRAVEQSGDISYIQGGMAFTRDRARQSLYASQVTNLQFGRAGQGYQISAGDVVADFSKIGSNLGVRGIYAAKQVDSLTMSGYAGVQAQSWEALFNRDTVTGQPARDRYLRDAAGLKASYALNSEWNLFGTLQTFSDRNSSLTPILAATQIAQSGTTGTAGVAYKTQVANVSAELGTSKNDVDTLPGKSFKDNALIMDGTYAWKTVNLHAGYHNIGSRYTSLASNLAPGMREGFAGVDWFITPSLAYSNDFRRSDMRSANLLNSTIITNRVDTATNRLTYNVTALPGLSVSLVDIRNWGEVLANKSRNASSQLTTYYSGPRYFGGVTLSNARQRTNTNPLGDNVTDGVQASIGRQIVAGELTFMPDLIGSLQFNGGYQQQRIANGTETSNGNQGVTLSLGSLKTGQFAFGFTNIDTRQPVSKQVLNTQTYNIDWSKNVSESLALKAYLRNSYRNHGNSTLSVDEKITGFQFDYLW